MNKFIIPIIAVGIILLIVASFFLISGNKENNIKEDDQKNQNETSSQDEQSGRSRITPIREIEITGTITSVSIEDNAVVLEVESEGTMQSVRIDDTAEIVYTDNNTGQNVGSEERIAVPDISYSDIEEGQKISATITQKGDDLSTIQYRSPVLIYE